MRRRRNILLIPLAVLLLTAALAWWPATSDRSAGGGGHVLSQLLDGLMAPHAAHARRVISPTRGFGDTLVLRDDRRLIEASGTFA
ncbi:MAG TPA: hypothetical protein VHF25_12820, partial [Nitriliruptorales bacterium]|nr:hypothetical protein [Nitriliruptorales bacterium]